MPKKKSFTQDNPALAFITGAGAQPQEPENKPDTTQEAQEPPTIRLPGTEAPRAETAAPAAAEPRKAKNKPRSITFLPEPQQIERKSKRYNLLIQPSVFGRVQAAAERAGISTNDFICQALAAVCPEETEEREDSEQ